MRSSSSLLSTQLVHHGRRCAQPAFCMSFCSQRSAGDSRESAAAELEGSGSSPFCSGEVGVIGGMGANWAIMRVGYA